MTSDRSTIDRREFAVRSLLAMLAGVTITITGCGDDNPSTPTPADETGSIANNHGHEAVIKSAELQASGAVTITFTGTATHTHSVDLTAAEIVQVRNQQQVVKQSSTTNSHNHVVTFNA